MALACDIIIAADHAMSGWPWLRGTECRSRRDSIGYHGKSRIMWQWACGSPAGIYYRGGSNKRFLPSQITDY